jgi:large subunit ribosomal protein L25
MVSLSGKIRKIFGKKTKTLRKKGVLPAILYGPKIKNLPLEINLNEFEKIYNLAGESSLIDLKVENNKKFSVLIHHIEYDPLTGKPLHIDFYQPSLKEKVKIMVPLIFEGEAPAVKELGGTLIKNISEIEVKALPQNLPHEIKVNIEKLKTFEDNILIKDLKVPEGVQILREEKDIVAQVVPPEKVEEELEKPIEEKIEEVEKVEKPEEEKEKPSESEEK